MEQLFRRLEPVVRIIARHGLLVLIVGALLAAISGYFALQLRIDGDFSKLIPTHYPSVQAINALRDQLGGENEATVIIESPSFEDSRRFAEDLIPVAKGLVWDLNGTPFFRDVDYRHETRFIEENALYLATPSELDSLRAYLIRQINDAKLRANPFYFELDEDESEYDDTVQEIEELYRQLVSKEYPISDDSLTMAIRFYPTGAQTNLDFIEAAYVGLQDAVDELNPYLYNPEMVVTLGGRLMHQLVMSEAIARDVQGSFGAGVLTLLIMVMGYFLYKSYQARASRAWIPKIFFAELLRTPLTALVLGIPLLASIAWTFGVVFAMYKTLNIMTSTLGLILFGLGIDFGIHFYARYAEERGKGSSVEDAIVQTFMTTGQAISVVAITTAAAFYILMIADFKGFSQFGFTAGTGTMFALLAMLVLIPALISFLEKTRILHLTALHAAPEPHHNTDKKRSSWVRTLALSIVAASVIAIGISLFALQHVKFEYDFSNLEPSYEQYNEIKLKWRKVYSDRRSRTAAYVLVDTEAQAERVTRVLRNQILADTLSPTVESVESLQDRFPFRVEDQEAKLLQIASIRDLLADPLLQASDDPYLNMVRVASSTTRPLEIEEIPDYIRRPFTTKDGNIGKLVIVYPSVGLSNGLESMKFSDDVGTIVTDNGDVFHAASTSIVASDMLRLMIREAPLMILLTVLMVVAFKIVILRKIRWVMLALLPLAASFIWMFGMMTALGLKLTFYNLVVLPTVFGIGDDSGIHLVHRYIEEGKGSIRTVLRSTGEHITVSSLTTMVGFGGLMISMHPGIRSIGYLAVLGIGMTLVAALVTLPAILFLLESRERV